MEYQFNYCYDIDGATLFDVDCVVDVEYDPVADTFIFEDLQMFGFRWLNSSVIWDVINPKDDPLLVGLSAHIMNYLDMGAEDDCINDKMFGE